MLTLPPFQFHAPTSIAEAIETLRRHRGDVKVIAGGTDLLPNMKHRLFTPGHLVGLKSIRDLAFTREEDGWLRLGALTTIAELARSDLLRERLPSLAYAASQVAGPQIREMGTLGGNLCLDTRCVYYNQTYFWRKALGFCLKKDGTVCHVVQSARRCVAAASNDTAPVLLTLGARIRVAGPEGLREVPVEAFYVADGVRNIALGEDELVTEVCVPAPAPGTRMGYQKLRIRAAIDYPALSVAVAVRLDGDRRIEWMRVAVSALGARPRPIQKLEAFAGRALDAEAIAEVGRNAQRQCTPLTNINVDTEWRRLMIPVFVRRAFAQALGEDEPGGGPVPATRAAGGPVRG